MKHELFLDLSPWTLVHNRNKYENEIGVEKMFSILTRVYLVITGPLVHQIYVQS